MVVDGGECSFDDILDRPGRVDDDHLRVELQRPELGREQIWSCEVAGAQREPGGQELFGRHEHDEAHRGQIPREAAA